MLAYSHSKLPNSPIYAIVSMTCLEESPERWFTKIEDSALTIRSAAVLLRRIKSQTSGTPGTCPGPCVGSSFLLFLRQIMSDHHPMLL
ncbi:hypothetical protein Mapa_014355 [Marchantia paleacea]|nr:hypothetical protein Mapa_014355 [Marchantia paleacea]